MRGLPFLVILFVVGCGAAKERPAPTGDDAATKEPVVAAIGPWADLYKKHGENLFGVKKTEMSSVSYNVTRHELVLQFDFPMILDGDMILPGKVLDYVALQGRLGSTQVGDVPREFMMKCGTNHGGDFEAEGVKYGVYVSGGCHQVRIFDATPEAVKMLVGPDFVQYLQPCQEIKFGEMCRSETTIRLKASAEPKQATFFADYQVLSPKFADGWLEVEVPELSKTQDMDSFVYGAERVRCEMDIPPLSPMATCGLTGKPYAPSEQCLFGGGCEYDGKCVTKDGKCVATNKTCKASHLCEYSNQCVAKNGECVGN